MLTTWTKTAQVAFPGLLVSFVVAAAATFLSQHYHSPALLFALLLGMSLNFLSLEGPSVRGIELASKTILRLGVALLGMRITLGQIGQMGYSPVLMVVGAVLATIGVGAVAARLLNFKTPFGVLTGGAVAICGASAALALAAVLPNHPMRERSTIFTIIGVSTLSTLAMITYPMIVGALGLSPGDSGIFLGGTIHDVAQVVGAGYSMSTETGDAATFVKLLRVTMLLPVVLGIATFRRWSENKTEQSRTPLLPWFAVTFALLVLVNSTGWIPAAVQGASNTISQWCLVIAMAAIGLKTHLKELSTVGWRPIALMVGETLFLAALVLGYLLILRK